MEVSFDLPNLNEAESMDPSWVDPQLLCSQKEASVKGTLGPFGLLVLASKDLSEQTAVFFRIFKRNDNYAVLMSCVVTKPGSLLIQPPFKSFSVDFNS